MKKLSILDLSPIIQGASAADALANTLDLARHAERLGYHRYWLAEHHNMPGIASAATAVVIGHVAAGTERIRVGSGGIMLPNHSPLVIAEQFGTLASLFPGRIDLGIGRAPGTDQRTAYALRRERMGSAENFPQDVLELQAYFQPAVAGQPVRAVPGEGLDVPIWLLGSSLFSARLAAQLGLPFAFAAHFAPELLMQAISLYRQNFRPSEALARPHVMIGIGVYGADDDTAARRLMTSSQQQFLSLRRGTPGMLAPPVDDITLVASPAEVASLAPRAAATVAGSRPAIRAWLEEFMAVTGADELIVASQIYDHQARLRSYAILAEAYRDLPDQASTKAY